jgi:hypothetical protein
MAWETFKGRNRRAPGEPSVTLSKTGIIGINSTVIKTIGENRFVTLMFDRDKHRIGMKFSKQGDANTYPVITTPQDNHGVVAGVAFLKYNNIFPTVTKNYSAAFEDNGILVIELTGDNTKKRGR